MLTEQQYVCWCRSLGFTQQTKELLDQIRAAPPARLVGGGRQNVTGRYQSRKMGVTSKFESHSNELAAVLEYENDPDCLEFYDQPQPRLSLEYQAKNGRRLCVLHTADFFVLRRQSAGWVECKTEPDLLSLAARSPARFQHASDGSWHCPPGEQYASQFGLRYELRSSRDINAVYRRNLEFLEDYLRGRTPTVSDGARQALVEVVHTHPSITLAALLRLAEPCGADDVYGLIATAQLYVDLRTVALVEPAGVQVFCNAAVARAQDALMRGPAPATTERQAFVAAAVGQVIVWDGKRWEIVNVGASKTELLGSDGAFVELPHATFEALAQTGSITSVVQTPAPHDTSAAGDTLDTARGHSDRPCGVCARGSPPVRAKSAGCAAAPRPAAR